MFTVKVQNILIPSFVTVAFAFVFVFTPFIKADAQLFESNVKPEIIVDPINPGPLETVNLRLEYFLSDLDRANITWSKNGIVQKRGLGLKTLTTQVGGLGQETNIAISFTTEEGDFLSVQTVLRPVSIDILWEADTSVPLLYKGKALPTPQSKIKVVALPTFITTNGTRIADDQLFYKWSATEKLSEQSGQGKNVVFLETDLLNDALTVSVTVTSPGGSLVKEKSITIHSQEPEIVLYEEDSLLGPRYERALKNPFTLVNNEISVRAEPFYFSNDNILFDAEYKWTLNNREIKPHTDNDRIVTLARGQEGFSGIQNLTVKIINPTKIRQIAEKLLRISF